jgi:hypothetical protein
MISPTPTSPPPTWDELTPYVPDRRSDMAGRGEGSRAQSTSVCHGLELPSSSSSDGFEVDHESHTSPGGADRIRYRSCCQRPGCFCASASRRSTTAPARASRGCATPARRACCRDTVAHTRAAMRVDRVSVVDALQLGDESTTRRLVRPEPFTARRNRDESPSSRQDFLALDLVFSGDWPQEGSLLLGQE